MSYLTVPVQGLGVCDSHELGRSSGLGFVEAIAAFLGPLVEGGAAAYGIHASSKTARKELRQRRRELEAQRELAKKQIEAQERAHVRSQQAAIQQAQIARARSARSAPYILGGVALGVLGLVALGVTRTGRKR